MNYIQVTYQNLKCGSPGIFLLIFINLGLILEVLEGYDENSDIIADFWSKYPKIYDLCEYLIHHLCISVTKPGFLYILAKHQLL